jgi:hypothetical protein
VNNTHLFGSALAPAGHTRQHAQDGDQQRVPSHPDTASRATRGEQQHGQDKPVALCGTSSHPSGHSSPAPATTACALAPASQRSRLAHVGGGDRSAQLLGQRAAMDENHGEDIRSPLRLLQAMSPGHRHGVSIQHLDTGLHQHAHHLQAQRAHCFKQMRL